MSNDNKKMLQEVSRWTRIGFLAISILGPVVNTLSSRLRSQTEDAQKDTQRRGKGLARQLATQSSAVYDTVATQGSKVAETVSSYNNDILQDLTERSEKASQELVQRSQQISRKIAKQSAKASKAVKMQSRKAAKMMHKQSRKAQHNIERQVQKAQKAQPFSQGSQRTISPFWAISSFSIGLIAAAIAAYLLVRRRLQQNTPDNSDINLSLNGSINNTGKSTTGTSTYVADQPLSIEAYVSEPATLAVVESAEPVEPVAETVTTPDVEPTVEPIAEPTNEQITEDVPLVEDPDLDEDVPLVEDPDLGEDVPETEKMPAISIQASVQAYPGDETPVSTISPTEEAPAEQSEESEAAAPTETVDEVTPVDPVTAHTHLGIVSTKHYYPIETPLNTLPTLHPDSEEQVVYFTNEKDAQTQGYTADTAAE